MFKQFSQRGSLAILSQDQNGRQLIVIFGHFLSCSISKNQRHGQTAFWCAVWSTPQLGLCIAVKQCPPQSPTITDCPQPLPAVPSHSPSFNRLPLLSIAFRYHLLSSAVPCCPPPSFATSGRPLLGCQDSSANTRGDKAKRILGIVYALMGAC